MQATVFAMVRAAFNDAYGLSAGDRIPHCELGNGRFECRRDTSTMPYTHHIFASYFASKTHGPCLW